MLLRTNYFLVFFKVGCAYEVTLAIRLVSLALNWNHLSAMKETQNEA